MRLVTFILALYIFGLNAVPCTDNISSEAIVENSHGHSHAEEVASSCDSHTHNHHEHDGECQDTCSPFCSCDCCGVTVVLFDNTLPFQEIAQYFSPDNTPYVQTQSFEFASRVFQPPKFL